jgi:hypothetical protein
VPVSVVAGSLPRIGARGKYVGEAVLRRAALHGPLARQSMRGVDRDRRAAKPTIQGDSLIEGAFARTQ